MWLITSHKPYLGIAFSCLLFIEWYSNAFLIKFNEDCYTYSIQTQAITGAANTPACLLLHFMCVYPNLQSVVKSVHLSFY